MHAIRKTALGLICLTAIVSTGCDSLNALTKLGDCGSSFLTPSDLLALNASVRDLGAQQGSPSNVPPMSEAQAQALATFLEANEANCFDEIQALVEKADSDPASVVGLDALAAAFEGTDDNFDPGDVTSDDLENIFNDVVNGGE